MFRKLNKAEALILERESEYINLLVKLPYTLAVVLWEASLMYNLIPRPQNPLVFSEETITSLFRFSPAIRTSNFSMWGISWNNEKFLIYLENGKLSIQVDTRFNENSLEEFVLKLNSIFMLIVLKKIRAAE